MKKYLLIAAFLSLPLGVNAASANIDISASKTNVSVNDTVTVYANVNSSTPIGYYEYTLSYDHNILRLTSGNSYNVEKADNNDTKSFKKEFKFKVTNAGSSKISAKSYVVTSAKEDSLNVKVNPVTITAKASSTTASSNNYLSSLEVEGYKISPDFSKKTTSYVLTIDDDIDEINVKAKASDENATVTGDGKQTLKNGENKIEIVVVAENGDEKTYILNVKLEKSDAISVKVDGKDYTVVKKLTSVDTPDSYKINKIKIDEQEVEVFYNEDTKLTLVALKDEDGVISLFIYDTDANTYKPYNVIISDKITFIPKETSKSLKGYTKYTETINNMDVSCYRLSSSSKYCVIYGTNLKTNNEGWYIYDLEENTLQRYNKDIDEFYNDKNDNTKILIYILSATTLLFGITTIAFAVKSSKKRRK